jgi:catechol 2,3-dioxygenase
VAQTSPTRLPATLALGPVGLVVRDLERSLRWYEEVLGLQRTGDAALGDGLNVAVELEEDAEARPPARHAGLFHYALLYPTREELAQALLRLTAAGAPVQGLSDHVTHEAVYLADPDGIGIELAADRPREQWPTVEEMYGHGPTALDVDSLLATVAGEEPTTRVGEGLRIGHLHLTVGDIDQALAFYRDLLGFDLQANLGTAVFFSSGGYHHHLGANVWKGPVGPAPAHTAGLGRWTIELPRADLDRLRDRIRAAGREPEPVPDRLRVRDPWEIVLDVVAR